MKKIIGRKIKQTSEIGVTGSGVGKIFTIKKITYHQICGDKFKIYHVNDTELGFLDGEFIFI